MSRVEGVNVWPFSVIPVWIYRLNLFSLKKHITTKPPNQPEISQHQHYRVKTWIKLWNQVSGRGSILNWTEILLTARRKLKKASQVWNVSHIPQGFPGSWGLRRQRKGNEGLKCEVKTHICWRLQNSCGQGAEGQKAHPMCGMAGNMERLMDGDLHSFWRSFLGMWLFGTNLKGPGLLPSLSFPFVQCSKGETRLSWLLLVCAAGSQIPEQFVSSPKAPTDTCRKDSCYIQPKADSVDNLARSKILVNFPISFHMLLNMKYQCSTKLTKEQHRHISKMLRKTDFRFT